MTTLAQRREFAVARAAVWRAAGFDLMAAPPSAEKLDARRGLLRAKLVWHAELKHRVAVASVLAGFCVGAAAAVITWRDEGLRAMGSPVLQGLGVCTMFMVWTFLVAGALLALALPWLDRRAGRLESELEALAELGPALHAIELAEVFRLHAEGAVVLRYLDRLRGMPRRLVHGELDALLAYDAKTEALAKPDMSIRARPRIAAWLGALACNLTWRQHL